MRLSCFNVRLMFRKILLQFTAPAIFWYSRRTLKQDRRESYFLRSSQILQSNKHPRSLLRGCLLDWISLRSVFLIHLFHKNSPSTAWSL